MTFKDEIKFFAIRESSTIWLNVNNKLLSSSLNLRKHFEKLLHQASVFERWEALSIVKRMALILFRIAMLLTAIRKYESNDWAAELICEENESV